MLPDLYHILHVTSHAAWPLAPQVLGEPQYLAAAARAGEVVWARGLLRKGHGLCHGTSGNAYALLRLYR